MRIISGKYKGKKLHQPIDISTRPLRDIVKESIFNLLTHSNNIRIDARKYVIKLVIICSNIVIGFIKNN